MSGFIKAEDRTQATLFPEPISVRILYTSCYGTLAGPTEPLVPMGLQRIGTVFAKYNKRPLVPAG